MLNICNGFPFYKTHPDIHVNSVGAVLVIHYRLTIGRVVRDLDNKGGRKRMIKVGQKLIKLGRSLIMLDKMGCKIGPSLTKPGIR